MTSLHIDAVEVTDFAEDARSGDDSLFISVLAGGEVGWYGPVTAAIAARASAMTPLILGADAVAHAAILTRLTAEHPCDPVSSWAVGALDCAMWDLHGQATATPVATLLAAGPVTEEVPVYASWLTAELTNPATLDYVAAVAQQDWAFTKWGLRARGHTAVALASAVERAATAAGVPVAADAVSTWPPSLCSEFNRAADPDRMVWLEDPIADYTHPAYCDLSALPIAVGEHLTLHDDPAVTNCTGFAALTLDIVGCGGLTKAAQILTTAVCPVYPHGRSFLPGLHFAAAFPEAAPAVEYRLQWEPRRQQLYDQPHTPDRGHLTLPSAGLGTTPRRGTCRLRH